MADDLNADLPVAWNGVSVGHTVPSGETVCPHRKGMLVGTIEDHATGQLRSVVFCIHDEVAMRRVEKQYGGRFSISERGAP